MNGYICFYKDHKVEVTAGRSIEAQDKAHVHFSRMFPRRRIKNHEITVVLAEKEGEQVTHLPVF